MFFSLVVAHGPKLEIGKDNKLLWHHSEDLKNFKKITAAKAIVMGRKTFESIGRALPQRLNVVITRDQKWKALGAVVVHSEEELDRLLQEKINQGEIGEEVMVIGGGEIYRQFLERARQMYITEVDWQGQADTYFPSYKEDAKWVKVEERRLNPSCLFCLWKKSKA